MQLATSIFNRLLDAIILLGSVTQVLVKFLPLILVVILAYMIYGYRDDLYYRRIAGSRIAELDKLSLVKMRFFMGFFMQWLGYEVIIKEEEPPEGEERREYRGKSKREDVDLLVQKEGIRYAVLVEVKENGVGNKVFQKLEEAMAKYNCGKGIIINNGRFNKIDHQEAGYGDIELWDRDKLIRDLLYLQGIEDPKGHGFGFYFHDFLRWVWRGG
ncbi:MAG: restriction endonuclease [Bacillota bacterium]